MGDNSAGSAGQTSNQEALTARVNQLEDQVKGLMETVSALHGVLQLGRHGVPQPDQYVPEALRSKVQSAAVTQAINKAQEVAAYKQRLLAERGMSKQPAPTPPIDISKAVPYTYSPLKAGSLEIRVLALCPNRDENAPIQCEIVVVDLAKVPKHTMGSILRGAFGPNYFTPLSYTWGTMAQDQKIYVDGKIVLVTKSLFTALRHFRRINDEMPKIMDQRSMAAPTRTYWWIDAVCINQTDLDEKMQQVSLMTRLYGSAFLVHVWLGEEADDSSKAMQLIRDLGYKPQTTQEIETWRYIRKPGQTHRPDGPGKDPVKLPDEPMAGSVEEKRANRRALIALLTRPWFTRVWCRQEVALPKGVRFHCGNEYCTWDDFMRAAHLLEFLVDLNGVKGLRQEALLANSPATTCYESVASLDEMRGATVGGRKYINFKDLVFITRNCLSTDPRDKIYAMLPMTDPDEVPMKADYRCSQVEAYEAAVTPLINKSLDFLAACQPIREDDATPSWIPDFSNPWEASPPWAYLSRSRPVSHWRGSAPEAKYDPESHTLSVSAILLDVLDEFSPLTAERDTTDEGLEELMESWWSFSDDKRTRLLQEMTAKKQTMDEFPFINSCYHKSTWYTICFNEDWDTRSRKRGTLTAPYEVMHGCPITEDPAFRRAMNLLIEEYSPEVRETDSMARQKPHSPSYFRKLALGRQLAMSRGGLTCLVPKGTAAGDMVVYIKGSGSTYLIRPRGEGEWIMLGETYPLCHPSYEGAKDKSYEPQTIKLV